MLSVHLLALVTIPISSHRWLVTVFRNMTGGPNACISASRAAEGETYNEVKTKLTKVIKNAIQATITRKVSATSKLR